METVRLNFNMDKELVSKIDEYAKTMHVNRTAALAFIVSKFFKENP